MTWITTDVRQPAALISVGSTADDFALALAWDRMFGHGIWVDNEWLDETSELNQTALDALYRCCNRATDTGHVCLTSLSLPQDELDALLHQLRQPNIRILDKQQQKEYEQRRASAIIARAPLKLLLGSARHLALVDHFDTQLTLPVDTDEHGGIALATQPPTVVPTEFSLPPDSAITWQVDLDFSAATMPRGRALPAHHLIASGESEYHTWVRSGRDGVSFHSRRWDFIPAGASLNAQLAHPRLQTLGLRDWVSAQMDAHEITVDFSPAGRTAEVLSRLWGDRTAMIDDLTGPLLPVLRAFQAGSKDTAGAYPNQEGVVIAGHTREGYLHFEGLHAFTDSSVTREDLRVHIDRLLAIRLLRRGLITDCGHCGTVAFVSIDALGQTNRCARCDAPNELEVSRWRHPIEEPLWFYDLHPKARELLREDGEVPLLTSRALRSNPSHTRRFCDVAELEFTQAGDQRPSAEIDLIACVDEILVVTEAKSVTNLGRTRAERAKAAKKLAETTRLLRGDQILLATTQDHWNESSLKAVNEAAGDTEWPAGAVPSLRIMTNLGNRSAQDEILSM